ncbi:diphthine--ammonia ligase [Candidatus Bathyarchaeota archaeon]|nr:diphthine--ammonia ligase [Candidatus Bathyarchaeota archaeon]MBS7613131.1 diphthine--ammonia ligase [Candidatus Bathyarchaeota archaeon]MBS7618596.1 diphthine--ammonia ligase [Candidatus Bathyarchaeota archaeon]
MKTAVLFSGGKDSLYALWVSINQGFEVSCLVTLIPESFESWVFHYPAVELTTLQAKAMDKPLLTRRTGDSIRSSLKGLYCVLREAVEDFHVDSIVSGVSASSYQRSLIDSICETLGLKSFTPLWGRKADWILREMLELGFLIMVVGVAAEGLTEEWLGRILDADSFTDFSRLASKHHFSLLGEGGEYETLVLDAPFFSRRLYVRKAKPIWMGDSGYLKIDEAHLEDKTVFYRL